MDHDTPIIDPLSPNLYRITELVRRFPVFARVDRATVYRWTLSGRVATDGTRVPLPHVVTPRGRWTTDDAVRWWIARLAGQVTTPTTSRPTSARRQREIEQAEQQLVLCHTLIMG